MWRAATDWFTRRIDNQYNTIFPREYPAINTPSDLHIKLAGEILAYIKSHRPEAASHLPESMLCRRFKVSRTPVRAALVILENRGYLERVAHRGFFTRKKVNEAPAHSLRPGLDDELYLAIAEDRISQRLPEHVSEADLVRRYNAPKSALTRALQRFLREGLVERRPGRGWTFTPVLDSEEAHSQSCRFRLAIEPQALLEPGFHLDESAARIVAEKHRRILDGNTPQISAIELFEMNAEFHELLARCSGNRFFLKAVQQQNRLRRFVNYHWTYGPERVIRTCQEHLSILEALQMNNPTWAANLLRQHIEISASISPYDAVDADTKPQHVISLK